MEFGYDEYVGRVRELARLGERQGWKHYESGHRINYKALREVSPETARLAVLEYLKTNGGNISDAARVFGINRPVVYDILSKQATGDLRDRARIPKRHIEWRCGSL